MSIRFSSLAVALLFSASLVKAQEPASTASVAPVPDYQLKNRSFFAGVADNARAPFWPIGWVKRARVGYVRQTAAPVDTAQVRLDERSFKVTSILLGSGTTPSLAVINGRAYSEGEFLRMPKGGATQQLRVRVQRINDGSVVLQNADQTLVASLQRPELSTKREEEPLLDPDR